MTLMFIGATVAIYSLVMKHVLKNVCKPQTIPTK